MVEIARPSMMSSRLSATSPRYERPAPVRLEDANSNQKLANGLASELWSRLVFARLADESGHNGIEHIVSSASASHAQIVSWHRELRGFVEAVCLAAIEVRGDKEEDHAFQSQLRDEIVERVSKENLFSMPPRSFVDYKFADLDPAIAMDKAERQLEQLCLDFANEFFALLGRLQRHHLVGSIERGDDTCRFTFFRRVAIIEETARQRSQRSLGAKIETYDHFSINIQHRNAMHVHHVRGPMLNELGGTVHPLPEKYQRFVDSLPDWLSPSIRVLEGELFREECVEWDTMLEVRPQEETVSIRWQRDPAIVFGDFVLAGWGEDVIVGEESRVRDGDIERTKSHASVVAKRLHAGSIAIAVLSIATIGCTVWSPTALPLVAIALGLAAMYLASLAAKNEYFASGHLTTRRVLVHSTLVGGIVFAIQTIVFAAVYWSVPALIVAAFCAGVAWLAISMKSGDPELGGNRVD